MRRTVRRRCVARARSGIISAHAENSLLTRNAPPSPKDHLRACGEQFSRVAISEYIVGSSPRMRRTGRKVLVDTGQPRIISAHAENRVSVISEPSEIPDHLRACGEQGYREDDSGKASGSSPRMRRTVIREAKLWLQQRIISAHAENSSVTWRVGSFLTDHLRACGEQASRYP